MRPAGRLAAAIDILEDIFTRHRPAAQALADWGRGHRFAGSRDRAAIGNIVYDALRHKASLAHRMGEETPRALALGVLRWGWGHDAREIERFWEGDKFAPPPLSAPEKAALEKDSLDDAPGWVAADMPEFLMPELARAFGDDAVAEGAALAARAPADLRVNTLKTTREKALKALARVKPQPTPLSPVGIRLAPGAGAVGNPNIQSEPGYQKGRFELQDEGSQLTSLLAGAAPGMQVLDLCAGAGGKTLALAAAMENKGQIYGFDADRHRLAKSFERLARAGVRNAQILPAGDEAALAGLEQRMDLVVIDAPCSGSGAWRRRPDAKWRFTQELLDQRLVEQAGLLETGANLVKPGGRLAYITCSILPCENQDRIKSFLARSSGFSAIRGDALWQAAFPETPFPGRTTDHGLLLTPASCGTDGFFISVLERGG